jgi:protein PhnA
VELCSECLEHLDTAKDEPHYWNCLHGAVWSEKPAVKVLSARILHQISEQSFAQDLIDSLVLEDQWKKYVSPTSDADEGEVPTCDSNGTPLIEGDSVTLIKDLDVKGAGFTAKRGTMVRNIHLTGDPALIEGKVNGSTIVLKTQFLKKA